ncbi:MAG: Large-conductance mechanosensitive channel [Thermocaproicibacter melissae]|jgi:large conductance mechanosensitive channel|uniref:large-conductance mechanosensitive channel protein MscL n=1 Tax=Thermocaproicibacter melissae TaxID=2966552 RepID=UPI0024B11817|nr:large-conductance mechanosensitive channel protein MscL [Thermocaproicibacter melissae]WBY63935.1 large-conductance mechanosensitive channel protein MscL [Thermocaproicibacter melissae]
MKKFWSEFRSFAMKGSMIDLAIGVIIGGAFSTVVSSLVNDIISPLLSIVIGRINISDLKLTITSIPGTKDIVLNYGIFLQNLLNFFMVALSIFIVIRAVNRIREKIPVLSDIKPPETPAKLTKTEELLTEIRDLLKSKEN